MKVWLSIPMMACSLCLGSRSFADSDQSAGARVECVRQENELTSRPQVRNVVDQMGGVQALLGTWNLSILGLISKTIVFANQPEGFSAKTDRSVFVPLTICSSSTVPGTLEIFFVNAKTQQPESARVYPIAGNPNQIRLANAQSSWKPYTFNKIQ